MPKRVGGLKGQKEYAEKLISEGKSLEEIIKLTGLKKNTIQHYKTEWNQKRKMPRMPKQTRIGRRTSGQNGAGKRGG